MIKDEKIREIVKLWMEYHDLSYATVYRETALNYSWTILGYSNESIVKINFCGKLPKELKDLKTYCKHHLIGEKE